MDEYTFTLDDRVYRVRGLERNTTFERMSINLLVRRQDCFHVDTLDMYSARQRTSFVRQASIELNIPETVLKRDVGTLLLKLEAIQQERLYEEHHQEDTPVVTPEAREEALQWLKQPQLLQYLAEDFEVAGLIGETNNAILGYLAATSRKLDNPLAIVIQSSSAAGKSNLMDAILNLIPPEDVFKYSALTPQTLYYLGENALKHKILSIAEEAGATNASYALKLLQSDKELTLATTEKDKSGRLKTQTYRVNGPSSIFMTTTALQVDPELMNRCLVLTVDETPEQTRKIHAHQSAQETLQSIKNRKQQDTVIQRHHAIQRILEPICVVNPLAKSISYQDNRVRARRDYRKFLHLIRVITFLHQYQRAKKTKDGITYIEATKRDVEQAKALMEPILGGDDIPPQTLKVLQMLQAEVDKQSKKLKTSELYFTRRNIREWTGYSVDQVRHHMHRLVELEQVQIVHRGKGKPITYRLDNPTLGGGGERESPGVSGKEIITLSRSGGR